MRVSRFARRSLVMVLGVSLLSSLSPAVAAPPGIDTDQKLPPLQQERSVPGEPVTAAPLPVSETAKKAIGRMHQPVWPGNDHAVVDFAAAKAATQSRAEGPPAYHRAGKLPVSVGLPGAAAAGTATKSRQGKVKVETFGQETAAQLGVRGTLLQVSDAGGTAGDTVSVQVDYSKFAGAYGANYGSRLRLVRLSECALESPRKADCRAGEPVKSTNDERNGTVAADVKLPDGKQAGVLLAVAASVESSGGTFSATNLAPSSSWSAGGSSGAFNFSYPLVMPPSPGEDTPNVSLQYSSASLDGRTSTTNNQASVVGDGWSITAGGYIERQYKACSQDLNGNQGTRETGDLCWASDNATMMLGGVATELVRDEATGRWRPKSDDGSRIERLFGAANGDNNGEHWKVTTKDGTQYFLGVNRMPGWQAGDPETASAWTAPVFGNHAGEPCHAERYADSWCRQAWRWNLDYSIDPQGNVTTFYYGLESNYYGRDLDADASTRYVRGGYLDHIEYGLRDDDFFGGAAARVRFTMAERCLPSDGVSCEPDALTETTAESWPDVPFDRICAADESCEYRTSPSFFTRKRLTKITTQVANGSEWRSVDSWTLRHSFPEAGDGLAPALWLEGIKRTGHVGGTESVPEVVFGGHSMENRVDAAEGIAPLTRYRLTSIRNETGGHIEIKYSGPECARGTNMPTKPETNTMRCYPVWWSPEHAPEPMLDWFHKYVVTAVIEDDRTGGSALRKTAYEYRGGAAWRFDDREFLKPEHRTWSSWRGYGRVRTIVGEPGTTQSVTETLYLRGMDGDTLSGGGTRDVWVEDSEGGRVEDHDRLAGFARETLQYDGDKVVSASVTDPWLHGPTATDGDDEAFALAAAEVRGRELLENGTWRRTKVSRTYDDHGLVTEIDDAGDVAVGGDEKCTRTSYARNSDAWMLNYISQAREVALPCSAGEGGVTDVISDVRNLYDGQAFGSAPTRGQITEVQRWDGERYQVSAETTYDAYGRITSRTDASGATTSIDYVPDTGPTMQVVTTNPLGHTSTTELEAAWGEPLVETGPNGERSEAAYDPLGRLVKAWLPGQSRADNEAPNVKYEYYYRTDTATVVATHSIRQDGQYNTSYTLYDGFVRERQTQLPSSGGNGGVPSDPRGDGDSTGTSEIGRIITDTRYDSRGLAWKVNDTYFNAEAPSDVLFGVGDEAVPHQTITEFDALERPTAVILRKLGKEQWRTTNTYSGDRVHVDPPVGDIPTTVIRNAQGEMVERRQYHGDAPSGEFDATIYDYTPRGELKSVTDPAGNTWSYSYDVLGRKISSHDPDNGTTTYVYDEIDQLVSTIDERGKTLAYSYDELGRRTAMFEGGLDGTKVAEWTYDTLKKGMPTAATRFVDGHAYTTKVAWYDEQNRIVRNQVVIPETEDELAGTYTFTTRYVANTDLVEAYSMPAAGGLASEGIGYDYNELGLPTTTYGWETYAQEHLYSPYGETLRLTIGEGSRRAWVTNYFTEGTRRLDQTILDRNTETGYRVADRRYSYDPAGNITSIANAPKDGLQDVQCFAYDYLRRLTSAHAPVSGDCAAAPTVLGLGGAAPYWVEFGYDEAGNRVSEVRHEVEGDTTRAYEYPSAGQAQPHTLTAVTQEGPGGTSRDEFAYDAVGNTVSRTVSGDTQLLEWNAENRVERVEHADGSESSYVYDADGNRLLTRDPKRTVLFLPGMELTLDPETGEVTGKRFYEHAGTTVAVRSSAGGLTMLFGDHQGTATESIEAESGLSVSRRYFTPFGALRGEQPQAWPTDHGFVGGQADVTGLTHLGAREYDPALGRFISVDPIMDLTDPQQMQGYSYSNNSPVTFSDPSGLLWGAACGPDGILCGNTSGMDRQDYIETRSYWMRRRGDSPAVVASFRRMAGESYAPQVARERVLAEKGISAEEYEEMRALANSKQSFFDYVLAQLPELAADLTGLSDIQDCFSGSLGSCVSAIVGAIPISKLRYVGKIIDAVSDAFKWLDRVEAARRSFPKLAGAIDKELNKLRKSSDCNSFVPGTRVLLADGSTKPIEEVELGDRVVAADPETGETVSREVVATIVGRGEKDLVEVTVDVDGDAGDAVSTITATAEHPFWVDDHGRLLHPAAQGPWGEQPGWYDAADLDPGDQLRTPTGNTVRVVDVRTHTTTTTVHNLTINGVHTYHVGYAQTLVHNECGSELPGLPADAPKPLGRGSTGRTVPQNLTEQIAMTEVRSAPGGRVLTKVPMTDPRWPAEDGWVKMQHIVNGVNIHYVRNTTTGAVDDFKFK